VSRIEQILKMIQRASCYGVSQVNDCDPSVTGKINQRMKLEQASWQQTVLPRREDTVLEKEIERIEGKKREKEKTDRDSRKKCAEFPTSER